MDITYHPYWWRRCGALLLRHKRGCECESRCYTAIIIVVVNSKNCYRNRIAQCIGKSHLYYIEWQKDYRKWCRIHLVVAPLCWGASWSSCDVFRSTGVSYRPQCVRVQEPVPVGRNIFQSRNGTYVRHELKSAKTSSTKHCIYNTIGNTIIGCC